MQGGLYVTPNAIGPYVRARAAELGLPEALTCLSTRDLAVGAATDPRALAARLWPLPEIAARYEALHALARSGAGAAEGPVAGPAQAVALAAAFSAAMVPDPPLPPELLPRPWAGATARAAAAAAWDRLAAGAPAGGPRLFRLYGEALA
ncbi:PaaX family transcriptional regulator C-terminal domain-containing protein [Streptomyces sp. NBC_00207]|nr:PaaX family transcriptional regulator C-terminal domain-containing protein [Streptomyces sp. DSM 41633]